MDYKFLLYFSYNYAIPIGMPLQEEILKRGFKVKWFTYIPASKKGFPGNAELLNTIDEVINYQPDIILSMTDYVPDFLPGLKVQIFHGFNPDKREAHEHFTIRGFFDLYCTQGPATTTRFKEQQKKYRHFEVIETGWSKMDSLFTNENDTKTLSHERPVILITSTFSRRLSLALNDDVFKEIKRLSESGKFDFIVTLHPILPADIIEKWKNLNGKYFIFFDTTNLNPLFKKADIMFSDTTSAIQEFTLTQKPIVTFRHNRPNDYIINVTEPGKIEEAFDYALTYPAEIVDNIKKTAKALHPYTDGRSSERVITAVINFLHANKSHLKKKPLNFVRKYKVRKELHYFTFKSYRKPFTKKKE